MQGKATKMIKGMEQLPLQGIRESWDFLQSYSSPRLSGIWLSFIKSWRQCTKKIQNCCFPSPVVSSGHTLKLLENNLKPAKESSVLNLSWNLLSQKAVEVHRSSKLKKEKADKFHSSKSLKGHWNEEVGTYLLASLVQWWVVEEYEGEGWQRDRIMSCLQTFPIATAGDEMDY